MRTTHDYEAEPSYRGGFTTAEPRGTGWVGFAAVMLGFAGLWNFIDGVMAISSAHIFLANANYAFGDLHAWGWIIMILGILQLFAAFALFGGSEVARWFGIAVAGLNAIGQLLFMDAYPWWALAMFSIDVLVIYALTVYAGKRLRVD
jgi:hypothetical protein